MKTVPMPHFASFQEFYPFYLSEHSNRVCRRSHFIGSSGGLILVALAIALHNPWLLIAALLSGYGGAWVGHFVFEKNRPASFAHPLWSFRGDWVMYRDMVLGKISF